MVNIFIKSFNRPFYLDRCLQSIESFVEGDFCVKVLDDGTPETYLSKIKEKHPKIEIIKSENYQNKVAAIAENLQSGKEIDGFTIPTNLWYKAAKNASDYFMMIEDDVWFTEDFDLNETVNLMRKMEMSILKLGWISNTPISSKIKDFNEKIQTIDLKIFSAPDFVMKWFFANKYYFYSILKKLNFINSNIMSDYWVMNSMLVGIFEKNYWLYIWKNVDGKVNEKKLIRNCVKWYRKNRKPNCYSKLKNKIVNTTFISSATNSYHKYGIKCDINIFNHIMNKEWYHDNLDPMEGFPKDIPEASYSSFLLKENNDRCTNESWILWKEVFKNQYRKQNVDVD